MAKDSVGELSVKISAHGEQAIKEFNRVDNAVMRSVSRMEGNVGKFAQTLQKKFSTVDIGKSILSGLGIGSGFAIAQTAVEKVTDYYREQAEYAQSTERSIAKQVENTKALIALRQTDAQQLAGMEKEAARKWAELQTAKAKGSGSTTQMGANFQVTTTAFNRPLSGEEVADVARLTEEYSNLSLAIEQAKKKATDSATNEAIKTDTRDHTRRVAALTEGLKQQEQAYDALIEKQRKANDETATARKEAEQLAERYREIADPLRQYRKQLEEIAKLRADGKLGAGDADAATSRIQGAAVEAGLNDFFGDMDRNSRLFQTTEKLKGSAKELGWAFSSAFEDAILSASKLSDVVNGLIQDIARIAIRSAITQPIGNWIGGFFGGGKAAGGPVSGGTTYLVGEEGPELFTPGASGAITPNHKLSGGGVTVNQSYSIGAGVTAQQLMPILAMQKRDLLATLADARRRGTAGAFA